MKLKDLMQARKVISQHAKEPISVQLAYKLMKFLKSTDADNLFYDEKLSGIINKYANKEDDGSGADTNKNIVIAKDKVFDCNKAIDELHNMEVEKPQIKIHLAELGELKLSINEMAALDELIIEEE